MFTSGSPTTVIDTVSIVEGSFKISTQSPLPDIEVLLLYSNRATGTTFGTCPLKTFRLSEKTIAAFQEFIKSAEEDFGSLVLEGGYTVTLEQGIPSLGLAEKQEGLTRGIGGK